MFWNKPKPTAPQVYRYSFFVECEDVIHGLPWSVYEIVKVMDFDVHLKFTEEEFEKFRHDLDTYGVYLTDVTRVPYHEPEGVE